MTLDGQPITAPLTVTGVVGIVRDLGAADQTFNGRIYQFSNWSDGMAASHTISTPTFNRDFPLALDFKWKPLEHCVDFT